MITRSGYPGVQRSAIIWHGDNHAWWEHLQLALQTAVTYALCGAFYTGADVPGFSGNPPDDLAVRFFQLGAFLPFFRGHSNFISKDKEPYAFSSSTKDLIKATIDLRYSLIQEWYTGFARAYRDKTSPLLPVFDHSGRLIKDQFLLFSKLLICPVLHRGATQRLIYLPEGDWYRFGNTQEILQGGQWLVEPISLADIPIFVKAGSVLVKKSVGKNSHDTIHGPDQLCSYPDRQGQATGLVYRDDGISVDPQNRYFCEIRVDRSGAVSYLPMTY